MKYPRLAVCQITGICKIVRNAEEERAFHRSGVVALAWGMAIFVIVVPVLAVIAALYG